MIETKVRIRPQKIAAIISSESSQKSFYDLIRFLSMVWGGKFAHTIYVDINASSSLINARIQINSLMPEIILYVSEKELELSKEFEMICHCKHILINHEAFSSIGKHAPTGLITYQSFLQKQYEEKPNTKRDNLYFIDLNCSDEYRLFCAITFGLVPENKAKEFSIPFNAEFEECSINCYESYAETLLKLSKRCLWLEYFNSDLSVVSGGFYATTIIVVNKSNSIKDLALFWNIRDQIVHRNRDTLILFPEAELTNKKSIELLCQLVLNSPINSNYCEIRSAGCTNSTMQTLAKKLRPKLKKIKGKDYSIDVNLDNPPSPIFCYEREEIIALNKSNNEISIPYIEPRSVVLSTFSQWHCDLIKDQKTHRYPFDLSLPKKNDILELLNISSGNYYNLDNVVSYGDELISVIFTTDKDKKSGKFTLPSEKEVFETIFSTGGVTICKDEKNIRYSQTTKLFGDLHTIASALSGIPGKIIETLANEMQPSEMGQLSAGKLNKNAKKPLSRTANFILDVQRGNSRKILEQRIHSTSSNNLTKDTPILDSLEILTLKGIIRRKWKLEKCKQCDKNYWLSHVDISNPIFCPGCGHQVHLKDKLTIGYDLNELVRLSIKEGIKPVILTAKFLKNLTHQGFIWYPGAKVKMDEIQTDFDILSCCDNIFIAGECKTLTNTPSKKTWDEIKNQIVHPIKIAKKCGFNVFFVSSFVKDYPNYFKKDLEKIAGNDLTLLFITGDELNLGYRHLKKENEQAMHLDIKLLLNLQKIEKPKKRKSQRVIWL